LAGLAAALAIALLSHCYAVVLYVPICAGELVAAWSRKPRGHTTLDRAASGMAPVALYPALLATSHKFLVGTAVFAPTPRRFLGAYALLLEHALLPLALLLLPLALFAYRHRIRARGVNRFAGPLFPT